jgi:diguanylate cyclase (GGDEF)-like protein/PAS domain S-box-containing protein
MNIPKNKNILSYGIVFTLFCLLAVTLIYSLAYQVIIDNVKETLIQVAHQGAERVSDSLNGYLNVLETISALEPIKNPRTPWEAKLHIIQSIAARKHLNLKRISISDSHGVSRTSDGKKINIGDRTYFQKALAGKRAISELLISRVDNSVVIIFAVPVYYQGKVTSVLYETHSIDVLCDIINGIRMSPNSYSLIINKKGKLIAHLNRSLISFTNPNNSKQYYKAVGLSTLNSQMASGKTGAGNYSFAGVQKYLGFAPIKGTDWSFAITIPRKDVFNKLNRTMLYLGLLILLVFLLLFTLNFNNLSLKQLLSREQAFLNNAIDTANIMMIEINSKGKIVSFNRYAEEKLAFGQKEILEYFTIYDLIPEKYASQIAGLIQNATQKKGQLRTEFPLVKKDSGIIYVLWSINSEKYPSKSTGRITLMGVDITDRVAYEQKLLESNQELNALSQELVASGEELRRLAYCDSLTGLPNRSALFEQSTLILENAIHTGSQVALVYLDIDNFKLINDSFGHSMGDRLLIEISSRLSSMQNTSQVFRLGGDEFVVLVAGFTNTGSLRNIATAIMRDFSRPLNIQDHTFHISLSMGITLFPDNGQNIEDLMKNADTAMYRAKESGKNLCLFFDRAMNDIIVEKVKMESALRGALENKEFFIVYQPQVEAWSGVVIGFEALIRWQSPKYDIVSPARFIKIAEETGLIIPIGLWVLEDSCRFAAQLQEKGFPNLTISINISTRQLLQKDFVESVEQVISKNGIPPSQIVLEITETALMESFETNLNKLQLIREHAVKIHLDDFGTGYSSLNYLRSLPIHMIKIDKTFIDDLHNNLQQSLIATIIILAHQIHLKVIAEGVERKEQLEFLVRKNCDIIQGFIFSKPVSEEEVLNIAHQGLLKPHPPSQDNSI